MVKPIISGPYRTFRRLNPEESFIEFEGSTITIPMKARASANDPWMEQEIKLKAFMRLEIYPPYYNNLGTREFQFTIRDWDLYGKSEMLNLLFFGDPRGYFVNDPKTGFADYVPATVTFNVSNHYHVVPHPSLEIGDGELFGSEREIEIRNLTSHTLRTWNRFSERGNDNWFYSHPHQRIYWEILLPEQLKGLKLDYLYDASKDFGDALNKEAPMMIFHKKPPGDEGDGKAFEMGLAEDRAQYLLAVTTFEPVMQPRGSRARPGAFKATLPARGFESNLTQLRGNSVLSSLYRPREPLEIRWSLGPKVKNAAGVATFVKDTLRRSGQKKFSGFIQIASPARSLGTADQSPDVGYPADSADFPARLTYATNYNIFLNREQFVEDNAGIAIAVGAVEVPPRDVTVAFDKPHVGHVLHKYLEFGPGHCTGMHEITSMEYHAGLNFARYWRTVPLDRNAWSGFEPYDPTKEY
jgi:hypothetical protein